MLTPSLHATRLFLHILAAAVWVGGQFTLAGLVPGLRAVSADAPRAAARRFNVIAWPAFAALWVTGLWNLLEVEPDWGTDWGATLMFKLIIVVASGASAFAHANARSTAALAVFGAFSGLTALVALYLGVMLHG